jgi:DNA-binding NtrC family response regulator
MVRNGQCPRLLIVEDEPRLREFLERAVMDMDFEPVCARSGEQALKALDEGAQIDLALLDLTLPGMTGIEFLEQVRQRGMAIPAIILTGYGSLEAARSAIRLEVVDFLTKPCSLQELDAALSRARQRVPVYVGEAAEEETEAEPASPLTIEPGDATLPGTLEDVERAHILAALRAYDGNRAAAAASLGISERTLYYRLNRYQQQGLLSDDYRQK